MQSHHYVQNKNMFFKLSTCIDYWKHSLDKPTLLGHLASFLNIALDQECVFIPIYLWDKWSPQCWISRLVHEYSLVNHSKSGSKERKKCAILKSVTVLRTILNLIKLVCYLNSKHESFGLVFCFCFFLDKDYSYIISSSLPLSIPID